jgi:glutathione peroxidase
MLFSQTIYDYTVKDIDGNEFSLSSLKGKKVMIVNTASKCGFTPQYEELEALYKQFKDSNFVIVGFPSNDFMSQEPGTESEIKAFCTKNYGVTFPMMAKVEVKGKNQTPLYSYLTMKSKNGVSDSTVKWNFQKYLINENGTIDKVLSPSTKPMSAEILEWIRH